MKESNPIFIAIGMLIISIILSTLFVYFTFNWLMAYFELPFRVDILAAFIIRILVSSATGGK